MKPKIESYLGFAKKSGNLVEGAYTCEVYGKKNKLHLVIIGEDLGRSSREKIEWFCSKKEISLVVYSEKKRFGRLLGKSEVGIIGITDKNFAKIIKDEIDKERGCII